MEEQRIDRWQTVLCLMQNTSASNGRVAALAGHLCSIQPAKPNGHHHARILKQAGFHHLAELSSSDIRTQVLPQMPQIRLLALEELRSFGAND